MAQAVLSSFPQATLLSQADLREQGEDLIAAKRRGTLL